MAFERPWRWILPVLLVTTSARAEIKATIEANMESDDCDRLGAYVITDRDIMLLYARVTQIPGGSSTRDHCIVQVRTESNRRLRIYIMDYRFNDCGNRVEIYDGNTHMIRPDYIVKCYSPNPDKYDSRTEAVTVKLSKQSPSALSYRFSIVITTDQGPDIEFEQTMSNYNPQVLSIGVIVGLAIAGGLLFVAIIAIAIYCIVKQRKKNMDSEKAQPAESSVYTSGTSKVLFPAKKDRPYTNTNRDSSSNDSHNSSYSSADGHNTYVNMNPDPKGRQRGKKGYENKAYASSDDGGHDRSRDSTGSDDISAGQVNGSFDSTSDAPSRRRFSKNQENGHASGSLSRSARRGSARSKSSKRKDSANDDKRNGGPSRDRSRDRRSRSGSGHRSGHRDSGRRSRSHGERGGSQRRSRSRSPHSQSSNHSQTGAFDSKGHNRMYDVSSMSKRSRESSNSSTSSRDSGDDRTVSYDPSGRRGRTRDRGHYNRGMENDEDQYGSQV